MDRDAPRCCEHDSKALFEIGVPYICHIKKVKAKENEIVADPIIIGRCCFFVFKCFTKDE